MFAAGCNFGLCVGAGEEEGKEEEEEEEGGDVEWSGGGGGREQGELRVVVCGAAMGSRTGGAGGAEDGGEEGGKRGGDRWTLKVMVSSCTHSLRRRSSKLRPKRPLVLPLAPEASAEPSPDPLSTSGPTTQHLHVTGGEISCRDQRLRAGIGAPPQPSLRRPSGLGSPLGPRR